MDSTRRRLDAPVPPATPDPASLSRDSLLALVRDLEARLRAAELRARGAEDALDSMREKIKAMIERV